jgi:hypothetical protein
MTKNKFDILFCAPDTLDDGFFEETQKLIGHSDLKLIIERQRPQLYASLEWAIPGLIVAYLAKPYFEGFLQEAGKDHYQIVRNWFKGLLRKAKTLGVTILVSGENKFDKTYAQSIAISIHFEMKNGRQVKLLFDNELSIEQWEAAMDKFSALIAENYENFPDDRLTEMIKHVRQEKYYTVYGLINKGTNEWEFFDDNMLGVIQQQNKKED